MCPNKSSFATAPAVGLASLDMLFVVSFTLVSTLPLLSQMKSDRWRDLPRLLIGRINLVK